jgi:hypothetical protein
VNARIYKDNTPSSNMAVYCNLEWKISELARAVTLLTDSGGSGFESWLEHQLSYPDRFFMISPESLLANAVTTAN